MAGLLHDIGLSELPTELLWKPEKLMTEEERAQYRLHPGFAKHSIERQKIKISKDVMEMILLHHERSDGSGYPYGYKNDKLSSYVKLIAFADEFDKLTSLRPGQPIRTPSEALSRLAGLDGLPPDSVFDPEFHQPIIDTFLTNKTNNKELKQSAASEREDYTTTMIVIVIVN